MTGDLPAAITAGSYDLVMAFEMIHDLARPVEALTTMRRLGKPDAVHLVMDEKVADTFEAPTDNPVERLMYAASVLHCLPVGRADTPSAATGTVMRPATFEGYADARRLRDASTSCRSNTTSSASTTSSHDDASRRGSNTAPGVGVERIARARCTRPDRGRVLARIRRSLKLECRTP